LKGSGKNLEFVLTTIESAGVKYRFLEFELDVDAYELRRSGQRLRLARQPMDLLLLLLSRPRELVTREDIANRLWEPHVHTDVEAAIHTAILRIRQVLGDPRQAPRFVETVTGKGYRFIAPVQFVGDRDRSAPLLKTPQGIGDASGGAIENVDATPRSVPLSLAVLPFANIGNDATNAYFSDGLAEELITALAQVPQLRVAGRVSAFYFRDRPNELQQVGKALDVDRVLEGSVLRVGDRLRVTARLVSVETGYHLWSARYDREIGDVFAVQDEITAAIVSALSLALANRTPIAHRHSKNLEAFELYLRGRHCWHQRTPESIQRAIAHFEEAARIDDSYALAFAGLAYSYSALAFYGYVSAAHAEAAARHSAARALELAPDLAESHYAMALFTMWLSPNWPDAEPWYARSLGIQADFAAAHTHYAALLAACRRSDEARAHVLQAIALDPLSPAVYGTAALCMFTLGNHEEALQFGQRALDLQSDFVVGLYALGLTYCRTGELGKGQEAFDRLLALSNRATYFLGWAAIARSLDSRVAEVRALTAELENRSPTEEVQPIARLLIAIARADRHETLRALERCVAFEGPSFQLVHASPFLGSWADEPSFAALLQRLHLGSRDRPCE
jgi:TolB-like protein/DNA-binding winged helix-turn-helix (wHTH) protein/Tfp pilus assembly protein PilF